jgi:phospholipid/cholesterol/gamma-HCH transport system permease protein
VGGALVGVIVERLILRWMIGQPVFALIIATVGCYQGFRVGGSAESVGRQTTMSVVQAIFLVLVVDAGFSVIFSVLGI